MTLAPAAPRRAPPSRRAVLAGLGGALVAGAGPARAEGGGTPTGTAPTGTPTDEPAQITTKAVIPDVGPPFSGNYVGQYVIVTDPTPRDDVSPSVVDDCDFADWPPSRTRGYQVLLADRVSDAPRGVTVGAFLDGAGPRIDAGASFIVDRTHPCPGDYLGVELEAVPAETFVPEDGGADPPLVQEEPGPTLRRTGTPTADPGAIDAPGQPGFGVLATVAGALGAALLRRLTATPDDGE